MSSGSKGSRGNKGARGGPDRNSVNNSTHSSNIIKQTKSDHNHTEKGKDSVVQKIAPTAEQLRIAQMIDNPHPEKGLHEKINQVMQVTGVSADDAVVALYDCDNDVNSAIDSLLEGDDQGEWRDAKKKKKTPVSKSKEETDSNKENRRVENKERSGTRTRGSGGPPRFRGRGARSNKDDSNDGGISRGPRRGRMSNGSMPYSRGRGPRGRGSGNTRTFQSRQPPGFTEKIDTWDCPPEKPTQENSLQIDNWDDEPSGGTEDWDSEWTGSLDQTTVFGSSVATAPPNHPSLSPDMVEKPENLMPVSTLTNNLDLTGNASPGTLLSSGGPGTSPMNSLATGGGGGGGSINSSLPDAGGNLLSMSRSALSTPSQQYSASVSSSTTSISQNQSINIAALLQKAAPCPALGRLPPASQMADGSLNSAGQASILSNISSNVGDSMKPNVYASNGTHGGPVAIASSGAGQSYSSTSPSINDSIFSSSGLPSNVSGNLGAPLSSSSSIKGMNISSPTSNLNSRVKHQRTRIGQSSSKIPSSAVEMPEDAMAALDVQFSGLEFGTETFDFSSEVKTLVGGSHMTGNSINTRDLTSASSSVSKDIGALNASLAQPPQSNYSTATSTVVGGGSGNSSYPGSAAVGSSSTNSSNNAGSSSQQASGYGSNFTVQASASGPVPYQNSYVNASSHSSLASISVPKTLSGLKESSQSYNDSAPSSSLSGSLSTNNASSGGTNTGSSGLSSSLSSASNSVQPAKSSVPGKSVNSMGTSIPPGVQQHGINPPQQQQMVQPLHLTQQHQSHHHQIQQQVAQQAQQQAQQTQLMPTAGPSQYVSPTAPLQGALPTAFYNVQQPAMYSYEDLQMFQQRIPHMQQAPTSLAGGRDGAITSPASYSVADAAKFRTDQNSSPVPSTINQQGASAGSPYITAAGNAAPMAPFYMYHNLPAVPSSFTQYGVGHPAIIQLPPSTQSTNTQFPGPPKLPYAGTSTYYDNLSQTQDFKAGYGSGSQGQSKTGSTVSGTASNSGSDLTGYKNHLGKVSRSYDKQGFHTGTPPPFSLPGSGANPMTANYVPPQMFIQTMPAAAQHHSPLIHHQLHQDGGSSASQRASAAGVQSKGAGKTGYSGSYWSSN